MYLWRAWRVGEDGRLSSIFIFEYEFEQSEEEPYAWTAPPIEKRPHVQWDTDVTYAECFPHFRSFYVYRPKNMTTSIPTCDQSPNDNCGCGIHAYYTPDLMGEGAEPITPHHAYGIVEVGGEIQHHQYGARVEAARPIAVGTILDDLAPAIERTHGCYAEGMEDVYDDMVERELIRDGRDDSDNTGFVHPTRKGEAWATLATALEVRLGRIMEGEFDEQDWEADAQGGASEAGAEAGSGTGD